ncbi:hypothetical protein RJD24_13295 [Bacillaceae bacterium IKA-2]|jgi:cell division protein FtsN|nr:hypothetical protein RJD24_13295 [Bacillaceae bacterium IKA-2]
MAYFLAISFLLHLITLFIIVVLVQKTNIIKPSQHSNVQEQEKLKQEIEDLLVAYTIEMKEENEKLINKLVQKRKTQERVKIETVKTYEKTRGQTNEAEMKIEQSGLLKPSPKRNYQTQTDQDSFIPPIVEGTEDIVEQSSTAQILSLAKQGYSAKVIAKRLSIGDGEVELLLKFHK